MKTKLTHGTFFGYSVVRFVAVIPASKNLGIPKRRQKTWHAKTNDSIYTDGELRLVFEPEAIRWRNKIMREIFGGKEPPSELMQVEAL